eukprot:EG_transcript_30015
MHCYILSVEQVWQSPTFFDAPDPSVAISQGPYDGVLGFSQGAMMAALLLAVLNSDCGTDAIDFPVATRHALRTQIRFGIMAGGFKPRDTDLHHLFAAPVGGVQTLHIIGEADTLVPPERSYELAGLFADAEVMDHPGG